MKDHLVLTLTNHVVRGRASNGRFEASDRRDPASVASLVCSLLPDGGTVEVLDDTPTLVGPVVHLNGTGGKTLLHEATEAFNALQAAREKLAAMTHHMRDYYTLPSGGHDELGAQRNARADRCEALEAMMEEVADYMAGIEAQMPRRHSVRV